MDPFEERVHGIAALDQDVRRGLYELLVGRGGWVGRDEAADTLGIPRSVAAFHLDKLEEVGLADTRYERTSGRSGPGAGRPAKLYRRGTREVTVSLPERRYALAAELLAESVEGAKGDRAAKRVARRRGKAMGEAVRARLEDGVDPVDALLGVLIAHGYEPHRTPEGIELANCPFHDLAEAHRDLVCGMNHELLSGVAEAIEAGGVRAHLDPQPGLCCVRFSIP